MTSTAPRTASPEGGRPIELARCLVVVLSGESRGKEYLLTGDICRVGKARDNHIVLEDETVSRYHFEIVREPKGFLLRDTGSTNGTQLDGSEIREAYLKTLSVVTAGTVQMKLRSFVERIDRKPSEVDRFGEAVGRSPEMREVFGILAKVAPTDSTVLLTGEPGTGKDLLARAIHAASPRAAKPLVRVDCAGPLAALEGELFGFERGAGALSPRPGAFEAASGGVVYLDEVGELPLEAQPKLLRALAQREVRRVGGQRSIRIDARIVASTRKDLGAEVERGKFLAELRFRLAACQVAIPPLRARASDVSLLVEQATGRAPERAVVEWLSRHDWPGNVRELHAIVGRDSAGGDAASGTGGGFRTGASFREEKERWEADFERRYLIWLMRCAKGNVSQAAREARMDRKYLHKLLKKHGVQLREGHE
ncbi:MAG: sigma 54-dependent Fis family transcriptional regulator [Deltaproteobacteria bacterium]|nr:sigma 54-dependent Fis family transcriptional regulator [Deltaproteobacteria bacterium]